LFCPSCGSLVAEGEPKCHRCGRRLSGVDAALTGVSRVRGTLRGAAASRSARPGGPPGTPGAASSPERLRGTLAVRRTTRPVATGPSTLAPPGHEGAARTAGTGRPPRIDGLAVFTLIGRGAFSEVYTAEQASLGREVAVKVVLVPARDGESLATFAHECEAMGRLGDHPHIAKVHASGVDEEDRPYIVMAHYAGGSLADRITTHGPLDLADTLRIGIKICDALHLAHARRVIHCDVKPNNILLSRYDEPVLSDFGVAVLGRSSGTSTAVTPGYAPPELLRGDRATPASDVYSLCATLYCCLTGAAPQGRVGEEPLEHMAERLEVGPVPGIVHPEVTSRIEAVIVGGLLPRPGDRPTTALELGHQLQVLQGALGHRVTDIVGVRPGRVPGPSRRSARPATRARGRAEPLPAASSPVAAPAGVVAGPALAGRRLAAKALDGLSALAATALATGLAGVALRLGGAVERVELDVGVAAVAAGAVLLVAVAHGVVMEACRGQTLGRWWTGTAVIDAFRLRRLRLRHVVLRTIIWWACALPLGLGFLSARNHPEGRGWPDRASRSAVVGLRWRWPAGSMVRACLGWLPAPMVAGTVVAWAAGG